MVIGLIGLILGCLTRPGSERAGPATTEEPGREIKRKQSKAEQSKAKQSKAYDVRTTDGLRTGRKRIRRLGTVLTYVRYYTIMLVYTHNTHIIHTYHLRIPYCTIRSAPPGKAAVNNKMYKEEENSQEGGMLTAVWDETEGEGEGE